MNLDNDFQVFKDWYYGTHPQGKVPEGHVTIVATKAVYDWLNESMKGKGYHVREREETCFGNAFMYLSSWKEAKLIAFHSGRFGSDTLISFEDERKVP